MSDTIHKTASVEERLGKLEREFEALRAEVLRLKPIKKDWQRTIGMIPDDELSRSAERLGREWREQQVDP